MIEIVTEAPEPVTVNDLSIEESLQTIELKMKEKTKPKAKKIAQEKESPMEEGTISSTDTTVIAIRQPDSVEEPQISEETVEVKVQRTKTIAINELEIPPPVHDAVEPREEKESVEKEKAKKIVKKKRVLSQRVYIVYIH